MSEDTNEVELPQKVEEAFADPTQTYPKKEYYNIASTNLAARGLKTNEVYVGGGDVQLNLDIEDLPPSKYPLNQVRETATGHVTEIDDTPGRERMLFKHRTGAGIDMRPDGTVIISSKYNTIQITGNDHRVLVRGDGDIFYQGNLRLHVSGDMDVEVGGNYNLKVHGDKREDVRGSYQQKVRENHETSITGDKSKFVVGTNTDTILRDYNIIVDSDYTLRIGHNNRQFAGNDAMFTAEDDLTLSAINSINITSQDNVLQSNTGMIGGDNVYIYGENYFGKSATFTNGVTAPAFHGDLQGTAVQAITADVTNSQNYSAASVGVAAGYTADATAVDPGYRASFPAPVDIDQSWINDYLTKSEYGVRVVDVDIGSIIKNEIDKSADYGGISKVRLTTENVRSKLRDPNTIRNDAFVARCIAENVLSPTFVDQTPTDKTIGRIANTSGTPKRGAGIAFPGEHETSKVLFSSNLKKTVTLTPEQLYNPELQLARDGEITARTALGRGIKLAKFLGGYGEPLTLNHITDDIDRVRIAKNLYLQGRFMNEVQSYLDVRNKYRLIVAEGFYKAEDGETLEPGSVNYLMTRGQAVVYELRDNNGLLPLQKTYDLAEWIMDYTDFGKMILSYDTYGPSGDLHAQIVITMPEVTPQWTVVYDNKVETQFNNYTQTNGELVEILE